MNQTPLQGDVTSLKNILNDIINNLNHQVLLNCNHLDQTQEREIELLIKGPIKQVAARLTGLKKIVERISDQISETGKQT